MAKKPADFEWLGFTDEQIEMLNFLDFIGNNGWACNPQTEALMPKVLADFEASGMTLVQVKQAMADIGYHKDELHELDRWESKRTTGKFGR
jgi:hypothetical protein